MFQDLWFVDWSKVNKSCKSEWDDGAFKYTESAEMHAVHNMGR